MELGERKLIVQKFFFPPCPACNGRPFKTLRAYFPMPEDEIKATIKMMKDWADEFYDKHFATHGEEIDDELQDLLDGG